MGKQSYNFQMFLQLKKHDLFFYKATMSIQKPVIVWNSADSKHIRRLILHIFVSLLNVKERWLRIFEVILETNRSFQIFTFIL